MTDVIWVPFSPRTRRQWRVPKGFFAFIGSEALAAIYPLDDHEEANWYGQWCGERIGNCRDEAQAKANIEHRWKCAKEGRP